MKRKDGESFEEYKKRRSEDNTKTTQLINRVKIFFSSSKTPFRKHEQAILKSNIKPISAASGKRHEGESLEAFKKRRKICNTKKRERRKIWKKLLLSQK